MTYQPPATRTTSSDPIPRPTVPPPPQRTGTTPPYRSMAPMPERHQPARERRLALSSMIMRTLVSTHEREQQRRRLVGALVFAQLLLTLAVTGGYLGAHRDPLQLGLQLAAVLVYVVALAVARLARNATLATHVLLAGGPLVTAAQVFVFALAGNQMDTALTSLCFVALVLEAGLLLAPELALIFAALTTSLAAAGQLLAAAVGTAIPLHQEYTIVVTTLCVQALASLIAWLMAQFIAETGDEVAEAREASFAQAQLDAVLAREQHDAEQLKRDMADIQAAIGRALIGDTDARAEVEDQDLGDLASSVNMLLERLGVAQRAERERAAMEGVAIPLIEAMTGLADAASPHGAGQPLVTNTSIDGVTAALAHVQAMITVRLTRVRALASEVSGTVVHSREGLGSATDVVVNAQALAGKTIAQAEAVIQGTRKQLELVARVRAILSHATPLEGDDGSDLQGLAADLSLGISGLTGEFATLDQDADMAARAQELAETMPVPAPSPERRRGGGSSRLSARDLQAALSELADLNNEIAQSERGVRSLSHQLGMLSAAVRNADVGLAWVLQALDAIGRDAEQLQQVAGIALLPPESANKRPITGVPLASQGPVVRTPLRSRPITQAPRPSDVRTGVTGTLADLAGELRPEHAQGRAHVPGSVRGADLFDPEQTRAPMSAPLAASDHDTTGGTQP